MPPFHPCPKHPNYQIIKTINRYCTRPKAPTAPDLASSFSHNSIAELAATLRLCSHVNHLTQVHSHLITTGLIHNPKITSKLISSLTTLNSPTSIFAAHSVALHTDGLDTYTWNTVIRGYLDRDGPQNAIFVYTQMREMSLEVDSYTLLYVIRSCGLIGVLPLGKQFHAHILKLGFIAEVIVATSAVNMYGLFDQIQEMQQVFDDMPHRDVVAWNSAISACSRGNHCFKAIELTREMVLAGLKIDEVTAVSILSACSSLKRLREGSSVHGYLIKNAVDFDVFVYNALLHMYCKCGFLSSACRIFNLMPLRNVVSWTTMVSSYASCGRLDDAVSMIRGLESSDVRLDEVGLLCLISACSESRSLKLADWISQVLEKSWPGRRKTAALSNAVMRMHAKCGDIVRACELFNKMEGRTLVSWTSMIHGLAIHGYGKLALAKFFHMQGQGIDPDEIVFLSVLFACSHSGLVEEGKKCFDLMINHHGMTPSMDHYGCMVDLLCRAGLVTEAFDFVMEMAVEPDTILWRILLGACLNHESYGLVSEIRNRIRELRPRTSEDYVMLSNSCATTDRWDIVKEIREEMNAAGATKDDLGCSFIETDGLN